MPASTLLYIMPFITLLPIITLVLQQKSLLMSLLSLEALILSLVMFLTFSFCMSSQKEPFLCLILLVFGACEASLGLALLVSVMRLYGNELPSTLMTAKC
uniref:NADH-ubiquinone oxidoreductase chain 4L n=1 Tax=Polychaeta sp. TaxID=3061522 RepID=A0AAU8L1C8_9ANNE